MGVPMPTKMEAGKFLSGQDSPFGEVESEDMDIIED